jgi:muramoyltetrapeptide carboxypeptidase
MCQICVENGFVINFRKQKIMPNSSYTSVRSLVCHARVALVAPSGPLRDADDLERAIQNVRTFGWEPVIGQNVLARDGYLAGSDAQRLHDLNAAIRDDHVDAIWCVRGGYGLTRILDQIDYEALRDRPKPIIGFSDITALHAAIGRRCHLISYHGPTARATLSEFSRRSFELALITQDNPCGTAPKAHTLYPGIASGRVMGGNLALLAALVGTPFFPDLSNAIFVLEDVGERTYRIDRMLRQLLLAGVLADIAGIGFGQFTECQEHTSEQSLLSVLQEFATLLAVPCVSNLPIGHVDEQWTIPLGASATLDADTGTLTILSGELS